MTKLLSCGLAALVAGTALQILPAAASNFDGTWAVSVVTEQGGCDAYRWNLGINGGRIDDRGLLATTSGSVNQRGVVSVTVTHGSDQLAATGTLTGLDGSGRWTLPNRQCSGHWRAEKRS